MDNILAKIQKLLAMAADPAASEQEAETASRQAAKLMSKYQLDKADVQAYRKESLEFDLCKQEAMGNRPGKKNGQTVPRWINFIQFGVKVWTGTRTSLGEKTVTFAGERTDVEMAVWLHNTLVTQCYRASQNACAGRGVSEAVLWRTGYASELQARLKKMGREREQVEKDTPISAAGMSLVIVKTQLQVAIEAKFGPMARTVHLRTRSSEEGRAAGRAAFIPTNRPIAGSSQSRIR